MIEPRFRILSSSPSSTVQKNGRLGVDAESHGQAVFAAMLQESEPDRGRGIAFVDERPS